MNVPERKSAFPLSAIGATIGPPPLDSGSFGAKLKALGEEELPGYLRSYVRDRVPAAFVHQPMLWEAMRQWIAVRLHVDSLEIGLAGSAQIGFSCAPDSYGTQFSPNGSDLDLFVVSKTLFEELEVEIRQFLSRPDQLYGDQKRTLDRTSKRGFIDLKQVPAIYEKYPLCSNMNNWSSMIVNKLCMHKMTLRRSYFRVYKSWKELARQTVVNFRALKASL